MIQPIEMLHVYYKCQITFLAFLYKNDIIKKNQAYQTVFFIHTIQYFTNTHYLPKISMKLHKPNYFIYTDEVLVIGFMRLNNEQINHIFYK